MKIAIQLLSIRQYLELKMVEYFSDTHWREIYNDILKA